MYTQFYKFKLLSYHYPYLHMFPYMVYFNQRGIALFTIIKYITLKISRIDNVAWTM